MSVPDSLKERLDAFARAGQSGVQQTDLFKEVSWFAVLAGQGLMPKDYHPVADVISDDELKQRLMKIRNSVDQRIKGMMDHDAFIAKHCAAKEMA